MAPSFVHSTLDAELRGVDTSSHGKVVSHYRGIKYGEIRQRFLKSEPIDDWHSEKLDCTRFGPQCPQNYVDPCHLLRVPEVLSTGFEDAQDEFGCLNINVSVPCGHSAKDKPLPVLIWIHGGSQVVSYPPVAHGLSDVTPLIARSMALGKGIIVVTFNYRLNIFGFGDGREKNLALKDQRMAIDWVYKHIKGFGGDELRITVGGESAGAVYVHSHASTDARLHGAIMQSGSLYLSPPQPSKKGEDLIKHLAQGIWEQHHVTLSDAPTEVILQHLKTENVNTLWIQQEDDLVGWRESVTKVPRLLIGDVEYESVIWRNGLSSVTAKEITTSFEMSGDLAAELKKVYGIATTRPTASQLGALDYINDVRFALPVDDIAQTRRDCQRTVFQYLVDQPNPWQSSSRAHHGVDLLFLFGDHDFAFQPSAAAVAQCMQEKWIIFINCEAPWSEDQRFAFGPLGNSNEIDETEFAARRRVTHFQVLRSADPAKLQAVFGSLAAGRISLLN